MVGPDGEQVSALVDVPAATPRAVFVFAHGAGAGMAHPFMEGCARRLAASGIAVVRYQFPYMERGKKAPDRPPALIATVRAAVSFAAGRFPGTPLIAGGKSMGGRMTSSAQAEAPLPGVKGLAFFGFPLHPAGREGTARGAHLGGLGLPMLFLQGSRDRLADLALLRGVLDDVRPAPELHVLVDADHGFHVPKRSGRTDDDVLDEACGHFSEWVERLD